MKSFLLAAFLFVGHIDLAQAQGSKTPPPNAIVVEETKRVEVPPGKKASGPGSKTNKTVTTGKNSFTTTTTTTTETTVPAPNYPQQSYTAPVIAAPTSTSSAATAAAAPAEAPNPWRISYFGEYFGPRLSNFDPIATQTPEATDPGYGWIDHGFKLGYQVHKNHIIGTQIRAKTLFDPEAQSQFVFKNLRFYGTWSDMIDTHDINLRTVLDVELPTSDAARESGNLVNFNVKLFWTVKTQLRNWSFSAMTLIRPMFYNNPSALGGNPTKPATDLYVGIFPWIQMDFAPDWALVFEGSFDGSHSYQDAFFSLGADDPNFVRTGVQYSFNKHIQINPAFQFYTDHLTFDTVTLYVSLSAAL